MPARRGGAGHGFARGGSGFARPRYFSPAGFSNAYLPYDFGAAYPYAPEPALFVEQPPVFVEPPAPPAAEPVGHAVINEYKWPAAGAESKSPAAGAASASSASSANSESEPQAFAIVLKDGSTVSAVMVFAADDGLHYVDPDERHLRVAMSEVDRAATLRLNRARNLNLNLPAAQ
jgi:hypothetical protein